ncbi:hypothetical protein GFK26_12455 [Variovorax paradoxus]|uniref:Uncharacterized protein n=1 Tax=Variovorax paradoxus TaxID=34073 RepID=A0A5Q0M1W0_VARPD|nr:hypothetical protein [Variovorax paradoxus]QFZ83513.1 hypothetical protein GFK26_12455 [Variovorax paradoxus]
MNLFQKAEIRRAWQADHVKASIHALIGDDVQALVQQAGAIIYGVVSACEDAAIDGDDADLCAVHNAAKALVGLSAEKGIERAARELIVDGLAACERLQPRLSPASIQRAAGEVVKVNEEQEGGI